MLSHSIDGHAAELRLLRYSSVDALLSSDHAAVFADWHLDILPLPPPPPASATPLAIKVHQMTLSKFRPKLSGHVSGHVMPTALFLTVRGFCLAPSVSLIDNSSDAVWASAGASAGEEEGSQAALEAS